MTTQSEQILRSFDKKRKAVALVTGAVGFVLLAVAVGYLLNNEFGLIPNVLIFIACLMNVVVGLSINFYFQPRANAAAAAVSPAAPEPVAAR